MKITVTGVLDKKEDVFVLGVFEEEVRTPFPELNAELQRVVKLKQLETKFGSTYCSKVLGKPVLVISLGKKKDFVVDKVRRALGKAVTWTRELKHNSFSTNIVENTRLLGLDEEKLGRATAEGLLLAEYAFKKYLSGEKKEAKKELESVSLQYNGKSLFNEGLKKGKIIAEATNMAREWTNEPAGVATPTYMEQAARKIAGGKVSLKVLNKEQLQKEGLNAFLGVGAGSVHTPKLLILEYKGGAPKDKYTALVGKGITFDSGGYNLKPTNYIEDMKSDMAGAAAVIATIKVLSELGVKKNVLGVAPLCENLVSGTAQKPGDIVKAYNGKTIEIGNTDAEGRLVLADALSYIEDKYQPEIMIDLATLTGACIVALGYYTSGMMGNDEALQQELKKAGDLSYDRVWQFPFFEEYQSILDSEVADMNNIQTKGKGREAGAIAGGVFLNKFVNKARWAHIDIAGSYLPEEWEYLSKYATGAGVRLLSYWFLG